jgi:hypothetical protein
VLGLDGADRLGWLDGQSEALGLVSHGLRLRAVRWSGRQEGGLPDEETERMRTRAPAGELHDGRSKMRVVSFLSNLGGSSVCANPKPKDQERCPR